MPMYIILYVGVVACIMSDVPLYLHSSLISTYDHFTRHTQYQHPDHLLSKGILPPTPPRWWLDWLPTPSLSLALRLLAFMTPVVLAVVMYWVRYHYINTSLESFFQNDLYQYSFFLYNIMSYMYYMARAYYTCVHVHVHMHMNIIAHSCACARSHVTCTAGKGVG